MAIENRLANTIKSYTGTDRVDGGRKNEHFKQYRIPANLIMLSNHAPTLLEKDDRRFFVKRMKARNDPAYFSELYRWLQDEDGYGAVAYLLAKTDISGMRLSDRPPITPEKEAACDLATKQDVLDVQQLVEESDAWVFTTAAFERICNGNRLMHIAEQCGLERVNLAEQEGKRVSIKGHLTEAEAKRLYVVTGSVLFKDSRDNNSWKVRYGDEVHLLTDKLAKNGHCDRL